MYLPLPWLRNSAIPPRTPPYEGGDCLILDGAVISWYQRRVLWTAFFWKTADPMLWRGAGARGEPQAKGIRHVTEKIGCFRTRAESAQGEGRGDARYRQGAHLRC